LATILSVVDNPDWDIFCAVVDNYGDIGVCWRLASQLAVEHRQMVRLWVDDLASFKALCPQLDAQAPAQWLAGVEIRRWEPAFPEVGPAAVVIEAFACHIPARFVAAMALCRPAPVWINLEYLSAENWVAGCHALSSPHPRLPLTKYFFFPGFTASTGGLLRERDLLVRKRNFDASAALQEKFWNGLGSAPPPVDALRVSLFAYENPALIDLLRLWEMSATPVCCLLPVSRALAPLAGYFERKLSPGDRIQRGALEIRVLPFLPQSDYDALLWACDVNFVRGEDSFVRAQWAGQAMIWHIYPQQEEAHMIKLDAFLRLYCGDLDEAGASAVRGFWQGWNHGSVSAKQWGDFAERLPQLREHAAHWCQKLAGQEDLSSALVRFCRSKV
jgi:uncharacterized repeat protein (TIGR03837 family)